MSLLAENQLAENWVLPRLQGTPAINAPYDQCSPSPGIHSIFSNCKIDPIVRSMGSGWPMNHCCNLRSPIPILTPNSKGVCKSLFAWNEEQNLTIAYQCLLQEANWDQTDMTWERGWLTCLTWSEHSVRSTVASARGSGESLDSVLQGVWTVSCFISDSEGDIPYWMLSWSVLCMLPSLADQYTALKLANEHLNHRAFTQSWLWFNHQTKVCDIYWLSLVGSSYRVPDLRSVGLRIWLCCVSMLEALSCNWLNSLLNQGNCK